MNFYNVTSWGILCQSPREMQWGTSLPIVQFVKPRFTGAAVPCHSQLDSMCVLHTSQGQHPQLRPCKTMWRFAPNVWDSVMQLYWMLIGTHRYRLAKKTGNKNMLLRRDVSASASEKILAERCVKVVWDLHVHACEHDMAHKCMYLMYNNCINTQPSRHMFPIVRNEGQGS